MRAPQGCLNLIPAPAKRPRPKPKTPARHRMKCPNRPDEPSPARRNPRTHTLAVSDYSLVKEPWDGLPNKRPAATHDKRQLSSPQSSIPLSLQSHTPAFQWGGGYYSAFQTCQQVKENSPHSLFWRLNRTTNLPETDPLLTLPSIAGEIRERHTREGQQHVLKSVARQLAASDSLIAAVHSQQPTRRRWQATDERYYAGPPADCQSVSEIATAFSPGNLKVWPVWLEQLDSLS